jgi:phospholipid-transporting ATPase
VVSNNGNEETYTISMVFEFDSDRKAQSVITKIDGQYWILLKGADSSVLSLLDKSIDQPYIDDTKNFLYNASVQGLRTLCYGVRPLSEEEFGNIQAAYNEILSKPGREKNLKKLAEKVERDLILIGSTAIEDQLQDNVKETI